MPSNGKRHAYVGLDVGLTSVKAAAFDECGAELHVVSAATPRVHLDAAMHDIDMESLWRVACDLIASTVQHLDVAGCHVAGIGVTGHGNGLYPVAEDLTPVRAAIASTDSRARRYADAVGDRYRSQMRAITGSIPWAAQPAVLMRWLAEHEPSSYAKTRWVLSCKDWLTMCLTGEPSADFSDASACGLVALSERAYSSVAFDAVGLPETDLDRLPTLHRSGDVVGTVTGPAAAATRVDPGTPVIAGCMDCVASTVGAGGDAVGHVTVIVGTWAINGVVCPAEAPAPAVTLSALMPNSKDMLAMEVAPTSATNLEWLSRTMTDPAEAAPVHTLMREAEQVPAGSDDLLFFPFLYGAADVPAGSGTFLGLAGMHDRGHLVRAVLEGVAQFHRVQLENLLDCVATTSDEPWRLAGGGAHSALWAQIFADVLDHPVQRRLVPQLGARGVASLVADALGHVDAGSWAATAEAVTVFPSKDAPTYRRQRQIFDELRQSLHPAWDGLAAYRYEPSEGDGNSAS